MNTSELIALYGALLSTILAISHLAEWLKKKKIVKINVEMSVPANDDDSFEKSEHIITVTNVSNKNILITGARAGWKRNGTHLKAKNSIIIGSDLSSENDSPKPISLEPAHFIIFHVPCRDLWVSRTNAEDLIVKATKGKVKGISKMPYVEINHSLAKKPVEKKLLDLSGWYDKPDSQGKEFANFVNVLSFRKPDISRQ
ncbi:hypothetical protein [Citreimonas sp.]|uniref:hypothetical protein n=1 Tax=Citreimonas sp. TaxID=3036715 RepID=UPI0040589050